MDIDNITRVNGSKNCPNCGAPIETDKCPYCGTTFIDFACLDADKPFYMKIKKDDKVLILKTRLMNAEIRDEYFDMNLGYLSDVKCLSFINQNQELLMTFDILSI